MNVLERYVSGLPWRIVPYTDGSPYMALAPFRVDSELGCLESDRPGAEQDARAICALAARSGPPPASPTPWRAVRATGRKDEPWIVIVAADATEVMLIQEDRQGAIDATWIVESINARYPKVKP